MFLYKRRLYKERTLNIKNIGDIEGIKLEINKLQNQRIEIQSKLTDNQSLLSAYEKVVLRLNELRKAEQEYIKEIEILKQLGQENFVITNPAISFWGYHQIIPRV